MDRIYHEKQKHRFCAQHSLNSLLQGQYFTIEHLLQISHDLDDQERITRQATQVDRRNNDETGGFSIQVIAVALQNLGLEMVPYNRRSPEAEAARLYPARQNAFICHFDMHWIAIRRLGNQWFDLNSLHAKPRLISNTYLSMYLAQLQKDKYSIWFITGPLPQCEADDYLKLHPVPEVYSADSGHSTAASIALSPSYNDEDDSTIRQAKEASRAELELNDACLQSILLQTQLEAEERDLQEALRLSAMDYTDIEAASSGETNLGPANTSWLSSNTTTHSDAAVTKNQTNQ